MGAKVTTLENRSKVDMEIRVFIPPARPDRYRKIITIKPGEIRRVKTKYLCCEDEKKDGNPTFLMVFMDGVYTGITFFPFNISKYTKLLGYLDEDTGKAHLTCIKARFPCFLRLKDSCKSWKIMGNNNQRELHVPNHREKRSK